MPSVGIRELKNRLSFYLKQVANGRRIEITNRGEVIAVLVPMKQKKVDRELLTLVEEGSAAWTGGKPTGASRPVKGHGRPVSEPIIEDRK